MLLVACSSGEQVTPVPVSSPTPATQFPIPARISVQVAPFASVESALQAEANVDWLRDRQAADAVTLAYATAEIREHLAQTGIRVDPDYGTSSAGAAIVLALRGQRMPAQVLAASSALDYAALGEQGFAIVPAAGSILITANSRTGLLYGAYAFLEQLGFSWPDPYETRLPLAQSLQGNRDWSSVQATPRIGLRGFWIYAAPPVPDEFAVWLARNRMNLGGRARPSLQRMIGMQGWGGHHDLLQQEFSRPGLFDQHPEWFGLVNGQRRPVTLDSPDVYFNPAFSNVAAAEYFAGRLIERLESGDLRDVDVVNVWPADARFNLFDQSDQAKAIGNETDNLLFFYGNVARLLRAAFETGRLSRRVTLAGFAYFQTQNPPTNRTVTTALEGADFIMSFSPMERDWAGPLDRDLGNRDSTRQFLADRDAWQAVARLQYGVIDYHNLSIYGGLVLSDYPHFAANLGILTRGGGVLYAYMHALRRNPGPRRLTNRLMARLSWAEQRNGVVAGISDAAEPVIQSYFQDQFGAHASEWRTVNELMSKSLENAKEMFGVNSLSWLVLQEQIWAPAIYSRREAAGFVPRFRAGGVQDLPAAFSGLTTIRASFRGLDESIRLQTEAAALWSALLAGSLPADTRRRMESDLEWFRVTVSRYRLLAAACDLVEARESGLDQDGPRARMRQEIAFLGNAPVLADTISPVNQKLFLDWSARLVESQ